jgi:hypothetical protein
MYFFVRNVLYMYVLFKTGGNKEIYIYVRIKQKLFWGFLFCFFFNLITFQQLCNYKCILSVKYRTLCFLNTYFNFTVRYVCIQTSFWKMKIRFYHYVLLLLFLQGHIIRVVYTSLIKIIKQKHWIIFERLCPSSCVLHKMNRSKDIYSILWSFRF